MTRLVCTQDPGHDTPHAAISDGRGRAVCGEPFGPDAPAKPEHNPAAWAVAAALSTEDWGRWARGEFAHVHMVPFYPDDGFPLSEGWCIGPNDGKSTLYTSEERARAHAVPAPWDADAYRADAARRGVEPGPLPSLSWTGEDGFGWCVHVDDEGLYATFYWDETFAHWDADDDVITFLRDGLPREVVGRIFSGATAAAKAMAQP